MDWMVFFSVQIVKDEVSDASPWTAMAGLWRDDFSSTE